MKNRKKHNNSEENQVVNDDKVNLENPADEKETAASKEVNATEPEVEISLEEKLAVANDKYLRLVAEFDNYRKRNARERLELIMTAGEDVIKGLLPVLDDFERALESFKTASDVQAIQEGVLLIQEKLIRYLESKGVQKIEVMGKELDTDVCDAISKYTAPDETLKDKIIDVVQQGYTLNGKVIRHAKVVMGE